MDDEMSWILSSRGWTKDLALGLLTSLFKVHSLGLGGFTAYLAATKNHHLQSHNQKPHNDGFHQWLAPSVFQ